MEGIGSPQPSQHSVVGYVAAMMGMVCTQNPLTLVGKVSCKLPLMAYACDRPIAVSSLRRDSPGLYRYTSQDSRVCLLTKRNLITLL